MVVEVKCSDKEVVEISLAVEVMSNGMVVVEI
jgi:hypothetical protein